MKGTSIRREPGEVRRIVPVLDARLLEKDLRALCALAISSGADRAAVVRASDVVFDKKALSRPRSSTGPRSVHWPALYPKDSVRDAVGAYRKGIFFSVAPLEETADLLRVHELVSAIESSAFYMGYHLAMGFAAGNCRQVFCAEERECAALRRGRSCVYPYLGRPSMESVGMDPGAMAVKLGWARRGGPRPPAAGLVMVA